jgi:chromosome segregation ATPase
MPSFDEVLSDVNTFPDDTKVTLASGVEVTLKDIRKGSMQQRDYTQKTMKLSEDRRQVEQEKQTLATNYAEAEAKLAEYARQLFAANPQQTQTKDDIEELIQSDPVAKRLIKEVDSLKAELTKSNQALNQQGQMLKMYAETYIADQHSRVINYLKQQDPELDVDSLIAFAKQRMVPRLDDAYYLMNKDRILEKERKTATETASKEAYDRAKNELNQPVLPSTRFISPTPVDKAKDLDTAARDALNDPEIIRIMRGDTSK